MDTKGSENLESNAEIFIACFTLAYVCLEFYDLLDALQDHCLYHISVILVNHLWDRKAPAGNYLDELMGELPPDENITEPLSLGHKAYGYLQSGGRCCLKVNDITLNVLS